MCNFEHLDLSNSLHHALEDLGFHTPTPIQERAYAAIRSGKDLVGISQTGTGKTFAYLLPLLRDLKYSKEVPPKRTHKRRGDSCTGCTHTCQT